MNKKSITKITLSNAFCNERWKNKIIPDFEKISITKFRKFGIKPTIALITANDTERDAVLKEVDNISNIHDKYCISHKSQTYFIAKFGEFTVVVIRLGSMGVINPDAAILAVKDLFDVWKTPIVIAVGIAMGLKPKSQKFGDVLISKTIQNYNVIKLTETKTEDRSSIPDASLILSDRFVNCIDWKFAREDGSLCKIHSGLILTGGSLVNQKDFTESLKKGYPNAIGNEMEASGIWSVSAKMKKEWIIVKGICDWGKGKTDKYRELAAASAVSLCKKVLNDSNALNGIVRQKSQKDIQIKRINSLKLYYHRRKRELTTQQLSELTKIPERRIKILESFEVSKLPYDKFSFPECSENEITKLEKILRYGRRILEIENKDTDFMGYLLSFYFKHKLNKDFKCFKAIVFDFDGTLTLNYTKTRSTWQRIWVKLGYTINDCEELSKKHIDGKNHQEWCDVTCNMFKSKGMQKNILKEVAAEMTLIRGCIPTLKKLKKYGILLYITSGSIKEVIEEVIGKENIALFEEIKSNRMTFNENGKLDRIIGTKFDFKGKASYIEKISNELNIKPYEILFVGNSNNDQLAYTSGAVTLCVNPRLTDPFEDKKWNNTINDMQNLDEILKYINLSKLSL